MNRTRAINKAIELTKRYIIGYTVICIDNNQYNNHYKLIATVDYIYDKKYYNRKYGQNNIVCSTIIL